jgi:hypothetical protein
MEGMVDLNRWNVLGEEAGSEEVAIGWGEGVTLAMEGTFLDMENDHYT